MSENKIVLVLKTHGKGSADVEYRVALVQEMEGMTVDADYPSKENPRLNRQWLLSTFGGKQVFTVAADAMKEAVRIKEETGCLDYGTSFIDFSDIYFPSDRTKLQRVAEMLAAGGWSVDGGELIRAFRIGLKVTRASYESSTLRFFCGDYSVETKDDRIAIKVKGQPARQIEIRGPVMRVEARKQKDGGGTRQVENEMLLLRFNNEDEQAAYKKVCRQRDEEKARQVREARRELQRQRNAERLRRKIIEVQTDEGTAKCIVLSYDYKENVDIAKLNEAIHQVFDGTHCPSVIEEDVLDWDQHTYIVSTFPITREQVAVVCKKHFDRDDDEDDDDDKDSLVP